MTVDEFIKLTAAIKTYFPKDNLLPTEEAMDLWYCELEDLDYMSANMGLRRYVATNRFAPTISDIREYASSFIGTGIPNEMEAWTLVLRAIRNSIYHAEEEFGKLPQAVQRAVVSPGQLREWATAEDVDGTWMNVTQSNFMRVYRAEAEREKEIGKLPPDIQRLAEKVHRQQLVVDGECSKVVEKKAIPQAVQIGATYETGAGLTDEQWVKRHESLERMRRILSGETE